MQIINIYKSSKKNKRFKVVLDDNSAYDFGLKDGLTYIDHHDKVKRENYKKRHLASKSEYNLITSLTPSPSLFSYYILWGDNTNIYNNIKMLNKALKNKL
jgi:hypothetical protein